MKKDKVVCNCYNVTGGEMEEAVAKNATSFEEIQDETNVSLCCGACEDYARNVADELLEQSN